MEISHFLAHVPLILQAAEASQEIESEVKLTSHLATRIAAMAMPPITIEPVLKKRQLTENVLFMILIKTSGQRELLECQNGSRLFLLKTKTLEQLLKKFAPRKWEE
jgi:hypothetical protein